MGKKRWRKAPRVHLLLPEQVEWRLWPTMRPTPPSTTNPPTTLPVVMLWYFLSFFWCMFFVFVFLIRMRKGAPLLCVQYLSTKLRCTDGTATAVRYMQDGSDGHRIMKQHVRHHRIAITGQKHARFPRVQHGLTIFRGWGERPGVFTPICPPV